jgi:hypothetical protein
MIWGSGDWLSTLWERKEISIRKALIELILKLLEFSCMKFLQIRKLTFQNEYVKGKNNYSNGIK